MAVIVNYFGHKWARSVPLLGLILTQIRYNYSSIIIHNRYKYSTYTKEIKFDTREIQMNPRGNVRPNFNTNTMQRQLRYYTINNTNTVGI